MPFLFSQTSPGEALSPQGTGDRMPDIHLRPQARSEISLMQSPFGRVLPRGASSLFFAFQSRASTSNHLGILS